MGCQDMNKLYCDCPFFIPSCDDSWSCEEVYHITSELINSLDENFDGEIDLESEMDGEHFGLLNELCDFDENGALDYCEAHTCIQKIENEWRHMNCQESEDIYCECPFASE